MFTWDGNYYAINLTERLGVEKDGGFLRIGFVHYNTEEEVDRGTQTLIRNGISGDFAITGEPTDLHIGVQATAVRWA